MTVHQISLFLENKPGRLAAICFGIVRLLVDRWETARDVLAGAGFGVNVREVVAISAPDEPGALARILEAVDKTGANVEYMYAFAVARGASARFVFRFDDTAKAVAALSAAGISLLDDSTIFA